VRDPEKCILCGKCVRVCEDIQGVSAIDFVGRGSKTVIGTAFSRGLATSSCINCGQCVVVCPTGALVERLTCPRSWPPCATRTSTWWYSTRPRFRSPGRGVRRQPGTDCDGQMVAALRRAGFKRVFDTSFSADLTIMEEASELVQRIQTGGVLPMFTSCSPGWIKFIEEFYPDMLGHVVDVQEPTADDGRHHQELLRPARGHRPGQDRQRVHHAVHGQEVRGRPAGDGQDYVPDVDYVLTTREERRSFCA
jgi:iron only hydrogenase large subunit-like protein